MKKTILLGLVFVFLVLNVFAFTENADLSLTGLSYSSQAWGDLNNDGDLDLVVCGSPGGENTFNTIIYFKVTVISVVFKLLKQHICTNSTSIHVFHLPTITTFIAIKQLYISHLY